MQFSLEFGTHRNKSCDDSDEPAQVCSVDRPIAACPLKEGKLIRYVTDSDLCNSR